MGMGGVWCGETVPTAGVPFFCSYLSWEPLVSCPVSTMLKRGAHIMVPLLARLQKGPHAKNFRMSVLGHSLGYSIGHGPWP